MRITLDAGVTFKWFLRTPAEADLAQATALLCAIEANEIRLIQPPQGLLMLKLLVQGEADVRRNRVIGQRDVFSSLRKELERGKASLWGSVDANGTHRR